jgi:hypothetical protein
LKRLGLGKIGLVQAGQKWKVRCERRIEAADKWQWFGLISVFVLKILTYLGVELLFLLRC